VEHLCWDVLNREDLLEEERFSTTAKRSSNRKELRAIIEEVFQGANAKTWLEHLQAAGVANAKVNDMEDLWGHP
jgi:itaconate CoA-transferase